MHKWQEQALKLHNQGLSYKDIANYLKNSTFDGFDDCDEAYQIVRRFIYKHHMRNKDKLDQNSKNDVIETLNDKIELEAPVKSTVEYKQDGTVISERLIQIIEARSKDVRYILEAHGFNADEMDLVSCKNNIWSMNSADESRVNCQSKITVKPKKAEELSFANISKMFDSMDRNYSYSKPKMVKSNGKYIALVEIADLHLSKLCWHGDCPENYDSKIAQEVWNKLISDIYNELISEKENIEFVLFNWAQDFFNVDNQQNTTTAGTRQDVDARMPKMYNIGCELLIHAIDTFLEIAPVKTFYCKSNHDEIFSYHAICHLKAWYRNNPNAEINTDAYPRTYYEYGNNMIGFSHGDKEKNNRLAMLMPIEQPLMWGRTKYREFHLSHLHSEHAWEEANGVICRRLSSPTATDSWHTDSGYIGAVRKAQTFIYDKQLGLRYIINTTV